MATLTICREDSNDLRKFYQNDILVGTSRNTHGFAMDEIVIYQNTTQKIVLKETNFFIWFLRHIPSLSIFFMLFINSRFILLEGGKTIGYTKDKWFVPIRNFVIHKDTYKLYAHKNDNFSLTKNNIQIALYKKESYAKHKNNTYSIFYSSRESIAIIQLFCIFIDLFFYDNYNGRVVEKNIVFYDRYVQHTLWSPEQ